MGGGCSSSIRSERWDWVRGGWVYCSGHTTWRGCRRGRQETGVNSRWVKQSFEKLLAAPCCGRSLSFIEDTAGMTEGGFKLKCVADAARETVQSHDLCCHLICGYLLIATVSVLEMELKACITSGERWWTSCYLTVQPNHQFAVPVAL